MKPMFATITVAAVVAGLVGALIGLALGGDSTTSSATAATPASAVQIDHATGLSPEQIYRDAAPGVVVITDRHTEVTQATPFTPSTTQRVEALGSGFVVDSRGHIVTNDHVVRRSTDIRVGFSGGASYPATVVGTDPSTDVAVLRVKAPAARLHALSWADSSAVQIGDPVLAIGNPFGLAGTMTAGIVSALGRDITAPNRLTIPNAIQTDAAINHGNSGGPLLDRQGRVIGINSQIQGGTVDANVGVGFALPSATAQSVASQLIATGHAEHAWLGVQVATIVPGVAKKGGLPARGVIVLKVVKGSPAAKAGLVPATRKVTATGVAIPSGGDAIVALDGRAVTTSQRLADQLATASPGRTVSLTVVRSGRTRTVDVTLGNVPAGT